MRQPDRVQLLSPAMTSSQRIADWADAYRRAWETADADLLVGLFTEDATYRSTVFAEPHRGHMSHVVPRLHAETEVRCASTNRLARIPTPPR